MSGEAKSEELRAEESAQIRACTHKLADVLLKFGEANPQFGSRAVVGALISVTASQAVISMKPGATPEDAALDLSKAFAIRFLELARFKEAIFGKGGPLG